MAILPLNLARVSNQLRSSTSANQIGRTQEQLLKTQNELTTGRRLNSPSDDAGAAAIAQQLRKTIEQRQAYDANLKSAGSQLGAVDTSLGELSDLLLQAQQISQQNIGDDVSSDERAAAAEVIKSIESQLMSLGNRQFQGSYLFAGDRLTDKPFEEFAGGVRFVGSETTLKNDVDEVTATPFEVNGAEVWGALSSRIDGNAALSPNVLPDTRLTDLNGAGGQGVRLGYITVGNGALKKNIDLSGADTLGDVAGAITAAGVGGVTAAVGAKGLVLSAGAGETITVDELAGRADGGGFGRRPIDPGRARGRPHRAAG